MNRLLSVLRILALGAVCMAAACGDEKGTVSITLFAAAPDTIEAGSSTRLLFAVNPPTAAVTIDSVGDLSGKTEATVTPADTTDYVLTAKNGDATAQSTVTVVVNRHVSITLFDAAPDAIELGGSTRLLFAVEPPTAQLAISGGVGDVSGKTEASINPTATTTYRLTARNGTATAERSATVTVGPRSAVGFRLDPATTSPIAGAPVAVTVTAVGADGSTATGFRGAVHLTSSDGAAVLPADLVFAAMDAGVKQATVTLKTAGIDTLTATDTARIGTQGTAALTVLPAAAVAYQLTTLPAAAAAGQSLLLSITARDPFGNIATTYAGSAALTSTDASDLLPTAGGFTAGVRVVSLAFVKAGAHFATVSEVGGGGIASVDTTPVAVAAAAPSRIVLSPTHATTTAGTAEPFNAKLLDAYGNTCVGYTGTVHFASNDANALVPVDYAFTAGDAGSHDFLITLKTAGLETLAASDMASAAAGAASWSVGAAPAASCAIGQAPTTVVAGAVVGLTIVLRDPFGNVATSYAGTIRLTATDARATLPQDVTYVPLVDNGSHAFSASLITTGGQTVTATDLGNAAIQCSTGIAVTPASPKLVVAIPGNANAGYAVAVGLTVKDVFDNPIPTFAGTVSFTSSDTGTGAVVPAPIVFTGSEGGVGSTSATFVTIGNQLVGATAVGAAPGNGAALVHGLVYSPPTSGRVRLIANAASNTQIVQLDLVANERLEMTSFFGGLGAGAFTAGLNLPLDTTRVIGDTVLFTAGNALPAGTGTPIALGRIGPDHVLYTVVSKKRVAGDNLGQGTEVAAGKLFYSVRLKLLPNGTVGPVFDGAQPSPLFRAAVRDQFGDDFVNQGDIGLGKLEIR